MFVFESCRPKPITFNVIPWPLRFTVKHALGASEVFAPMAETLKKNVRRTGRQRLSAGSHFPIHGSTVLCRKYMMCVFSVLWCSAVANGELACEDHEDPVNLLQHGGVHDKVNLTTMFDAQVVEDINMEPVMQCLRLTTPELQTLKYPKDAEKHFEQLQKVLAPYVQVAKNNMHDHRCEEGFCGPWIEDQWIEHFLSTWQNRTSGKDATKRLAEVFGPFIPIFILYHDLHDTSFGEYDKMIDTLQKSLRPDVAYITIAARAQGFIADRSDMSPLQHERMLHIMKTFPNVVVLSPAGYGHVPIPHLKQPEELLQEPFFKPMAKRDLLVSFMGRYTKPTPNGFRRKMKEMVEEDGRCNSQNPTCFF